MAAIFIAALVRGAAAAEEGVSPGAGVTPPLPFVAIQGAALDASAWKSLRPLTLSQGEDLYALVLAALDLGELRPDLADLRLVDDSEHQVPFILEPDVAEERVALAIERLNAASDGQEQRARSSRYALRIPTAAGHRRVHLPLRRLSLTIADDFFHRYARLTTGPRPGTRGRLPATVFAGELARAPGEERAIELELDGRRLDELTLEVDEGDNAPLTLSGAVGVVSVPRIVFKARSGSYRLLLGNPQAAAPRYDLATLGREVLRYSARQAAAGPLEINPAHRPSVAEYFQAAPPTLLLWSALIVAVVLLLWLTLRILRAEPIPSRTVRRPEGDRGHTS